MKNNLAEGSILKNLIIFSIPFLFSYFLQTFYGLADLFICGRFYGPSVITAVSIGSQIMHMLTVIFVGLSMGTAVLISRAVGEKKDNDISYIITNSSVLFLIISIIVSLSLLLLTDCILDLMAVPYASTFECKKYLKICFLGIPFIVAYNLMAAFYRGLGDSKSPLQFVFIACILNIIFDFLFVGYCKMGASGAALATVTSQFFSVLFSIFRWKTSGIKVNCSHIVLKKRILAALVKIGLPVAVQDGFIQISFLIITRIADERGVEIAAAVGIVEKIISFLFLVPSSMLSAISTISGQSIGSRDYKRASKTLFYGMLISVSVGIVFSVILQFIPEKAVSVFTKDSIVIKFGSDYLRAYVLDCIFAAIHFCFTGYFCAFGYSILSFIHNFLSIIIFRIPGARYASDNFPDNLYPMGLAAPAGSLLSALLCLIFYFLLFRRNKIFINK